jgi:D-alanyl-D-alanine carboxypeptidase
VIGKTGWTREARRCFVGAAAEDGRRVIVSVLGSEDLWDDVRMLVDYAFGRATEPIGSQEASAGSPARVGDRPTSGTDEADWQAAASAPVGDELLRERQRAGGSVREERSRRQTSAIRYQVRLASFRSRAKATRFRQRVAKGGYQAMIQSLPTRRNNVYHVTVGSYTSRASAQKAAHKFRKMYRVDPLVVAARI